MAAYEGMRAALKQYLQKHDLEAKINAMVNRTVRERPKDPFGLMSQLMREASPGLKGIQAVKALRTYDTSGKLQMEVLVRTAQGRFTSTCCSGLPQYKGAWNADDGGPAKGAGGGGDGEGEDGEGGEGEDGAEAKEDTKEEDEDDDEEKDTRTEEELLADGITPPSYADSAKEADANKAHVDFAIKFHRDHIAPLVKNRDAMDQDALDGDMLKVYNDEKHRVEEKKDMAAAKKAEEDTVVGDAAADAAKPPAETDDDIRLKLVRRLIFATSAAVCRAAAAQKEVPLYRHVADLAQRGEELFLPVPVFSLLAGGVVAKAKGCELVWRDINMIPSGAASIADAMRIGSKVAVALQAILPERNLATARTADGSFAPPDVKTPEIALEIALQAVSRAQCKGKVKLGVVAAASTYFVQGDVGDDLLADAPMGEYDFGAKAGVPETKTEEEVTELYRSMLERFPVACIEDPYGNNEWEAWNRFTEEFGRQTQIVGNGLLQLNASRVGEAAKGKACNAMYVALEQCPTVGYAIRKVKLAQAQGWGVVMGMGPDAAADSFMADLGVGLQVGQLRAGAMHGAAGMAVFNQLVRIESELGSAAEYVGDRFKRTI